MNLELLHSILVFILIKVIFTAQQYEVSKLRCIEGDGNGQGDKLLAKIRKPVGFRGYPYFADDKQIRPSTDPICQIRPDPKDTTGLLYRLVIMDFHKCGVGKQNGFTTVRIWFPTLPGLVLMSDQEVLLICRPPQSTVIENRAAGIAGNIPVQGRISGTIEESASRPEYGVSVFREANSRSGNFVMPVDQAIPIGTQLQIRASVNTESMWKYAKLIEVTVSTDPNNAYQPGFIFLVQKGCRNTDYQTIVPNQPHRISNSNGEIGLEFEAFLLENMAPTDVLWIHTKIKACVKSNDCEPSRCLDLTDPVGFGKRRKRETLNNKTDENKSDDETDKNNFSQNIGIKIIPAGDLLNDVLKQPNVTHCNFLLVIVIVLSSILFTAIVTVILLACRIHNSTRTENKLNGFTNSQWHFTRRPIRHRFDS